MMRHAAHRAALRSDGYLAGPLLAYQRRHGLTDAGLAATLGVTEADLWRLCLCRPVRGWQADWTAVVTAVECDPDALRRVLEE